MCVSSLWKLETWLNTSGEFFVTDDKTQPVNTPSHSLPDDKKDSWSPPSTGPRLADATCAKMFQLTVGNLIRGGRIAAPVQTQPAAIKGTPSWPGLRRHEAPSAAPAAARGSTETSASRRLHFAPVSSSSRCERSCFFPSPPRCPAGTRVRAHRSGGAEPPSQQAPFDLHHQHGRRRHPAGRTHQAHEVQCWL